MGLRICKNLLELQDGSLHIESQVHAGTKVGFTLPFLISEEKIPEVEDNLDELMKILGGGR